MVQPGTHIPGASYGGSRHPGDTDHRWADAFWQDIWLGAKAQPPTPDEVDRARINLHAALSGAWSEEGSEVYEDLPMRVSFAIWTEDTGPKRSTRLLIPVAVPQDDPILVISVASPRCFRESLNTVGSFLVRLALVRPCW